MQRQFRPINDLKSEIRFPKLTIANRLAFVKNLLRSIAGDSNFQCETVWSSREGPPDLATSKLFSKCGVGTGPLQSVVTGW